MRSSRKIILAVAILVIGAVVILWSYGQFLKRQDRVLAGTARPTFPYSDYTQEELNKMYPQYVENTAPTVQTPEQTHAKFIAALKKGDFDEAVNCCFREGDRVKMKKNLKNVQRQNLLQKMIFDLRIISKETVNNIRAAYSYSTIKDGKEYGQTMYFIKDSRGVWLIESL